MKLLPLVELTLFNEVFGNILMDKMVRIICVGDLFDVLGVIVLNFNIFVKLYEPNKQLFNHIDYHHKIVEVNLVKIGSIGVD
jgi:hypothetical protein